MEYLNLIQQYSILIQPLILTLLFGISIISFILMIIEDNKGE